MCGFLGEFLREEKDLTLESEFHDLLMLSKHRGPDATQIKRCGNSQLGFNRLAILDVSSNGNQPKASPSKRYHCVFNGEIYNYRALSEYHKLKGLKSSSDIEVLIHLLDILGVKEAIRSLNGMFSIAIIDTKENQLYLTRDFAGVKPLFYGVCSKGVVFASQFNQVWKHPLFFNSKKLRDDVVKEYFGLGYMQSPNTIYQNVFQVTPGDLLTISHGGNIQKTEITLFDSNYHEQKNISKNKAQTNLHSKLIKSVRRQLVSDVPLATFLSGGIDSPLISALAKAESSEISSFTLGVNSKEYDESEQAKAYAKHIKVNHILEKIESNDIQKSIEDHFNYLSEPFGDYSSIPTFIVCKKAKRSHTVMLSGDGGDELFLGYPRMQDVLRKRIWFKIPYVIRKPLVRILIKLKLYKSWAPYTHKKMRSFVLAKQLQIPEVTLDSFFSTSFSEDLEQLFEVDKESSNKEILHKLRWSEFYGHLQRVLIKVDRMSMAHSLEVRVPFLDKEVILEAWKTIPKLNGTKFQLKEKLKELIAIYYPKDMIEAKKKGFSVPVEEWLRNELKNDLKHVILNTPLYGIRDDKVNMIRKYIQDFLDRKHDHSWGVWHVYAWQKWALNEKLIE